MIVSIIAAIDRNNVIGQDGQLPWHLPGDLRRFRELTKGHHVIMGRLTWMSIPQPTMGELILPGRRVIVLTGNAARYHQYIPPYVTTMTSLTAALDHAKAAGETECFLAGGAEVYALGMAYADRMYLTEVNTVIKGGKLVRFPVLAPHQWEVTDKRGPYQDAEFRYTYKTYNAVEKKHDTRIRNRRKTRRTDDAVTLAQPSSE